MATVTTPDESNANLLATVSSLYGPGTVTCWYLTTFALLVSWTLHPHRRKSGSIDVDLIATLTLPMVAAGHLISQARLLLHRSRFDYYKPHYSVAAIEAPFVIVEIAMPISVILFLIAAWRRAFRRLIITGQLGLLCYSVECYIHFSSFPALNLRYNPKGRTHVAFQRYFVADFTAITVAIIVLLVVVSLFSAAILAVFARYNHHQPREPQASDRRSDSVAMQAMSVTAIAHGLPESSHNHAAFTSETRRLAAPDQHYRSGSVDHQLKYMTILTTIFLPVTFVLSLSATVVPVLNSTGGFKYLLKTWLRITFFPRTSSSINDLDQAVAVAAGATILAFNLYSVLKAHYKENNAGNPSSAHLTSVELHERENTPSH